MAGSPLTLSCLAKGNPKPIINWTFMTATGWSEGRGQGSQLIFKDVGLSDAGHYVCVATNTEGNQSANVEVVVHGKCEALWYSIKHLKIHVMKSTGGVVDNKFLMLAASWCRSYDPRMITWYRWQYQQKCNLFILKNNLKKIQAQQICVKIMISFQHIQ